MRISFAPTPLPPPFEGRNSCDKDLSDIFRSTIRRLVTLDLRSISLDPYGSNRFRLPLISWQEVTLPIRSVL